MPGRRRIRFVVAALLVLACPTAARGQSGAQAATLYEQGRAQDAFDMARAVLQQAPNDYVSLFVAARVEQDRGRYAEALTYAERLGRGYRGSAAVWELLTQLYQAIGNADGRDDALRELVQAQTSAVDPAIRARAYVIRDRIDLPARSILGRENFETGSGDFIKYLFIPKDDLANPKAYLMVASDDALTETWIESGMLPRGKRLFHLDSVFRTADGRTARAVYQMYTDLPDYDTIRAKVLEILSGKAMPLSGPVGGLAVPPPR